MCQQINLNGSVEAIHFIGGPTPKNNYHVEDGSSNRAQQRNRKRNAKNKQNWNLDAATKSPKRVPKESAVTKVEDPYRDDILAVVTQQQRHMLQDLMSFVNYLKSTTSYQILTSTTQPAHIIAVMVMSLVVYILWPNIIGVAVMKERNVFALIFYLGSFAAHFGAQIWMTFISGIALYFSLPRHTFGLCQEILFPKYYGFGSLLSICTLILFVKTNNSTWDTTSIIQIIVLTLCSIIELTIRLYLAPPLLSLMRVKHEYESKAGSGQEVGHLLQGDLISCNNYQKVQKSFRKIHMVIAIGNIVSLVCTVVHLQFLATKINF